MKVQRTWFPLAPFVYVVHGMGTRVPIERPPPCRGAVEAWIAVSERVAEMMCWRDGVDRSAIHVIPNFLDLEHWKAIYPPQSPPRRLLFVGSPIDRDCHGLVAAACAAAGMTPRFIGHRERCDVRSELQYADVVATIGRGVLEAAACARPVVILGGLGFDGLLTPETAVEAMATNYSGFARRAMP